MRSLRPRCAGGGANAVCEGGVALGISEGLGVFWGEEPWQKQGLQGAGGMRRALRDRCCCSSPHPRCAGAAGLPLALPHQAEQMAGLTQRSHIAERAHCGDKRHPFLSHRWFPAFLQHRIKRADRSTVAVR